jgi:hypothetical protein
MTIIDQARQPRAAVADVLQGSVRRRHERLHAVGSRLEIVLRHDALLARLRAARCARMLSRFLA